MSEMFRPLREEQFDDASLDGVRAARRRQQRTRVVAAGVAGAVVLGGGLGGYVLTRPHGPQVAVASASGGVPTSASDPDAPSTSTLEAASGVVCPPAARLGAPRSTHARAADALLPTGATRLTWCSYGTATPWQVSAVEGRAAAEGLAVSMGDTMDARGAGSCVRAPLSVPVILVATYPDGSVVEVARDSCERVGNGRATAKDGPKAATALALAYRHDAEAAAGKPSGAGGAAALTITTSNPTSAQITLSSGPDCLIGPPEVVETADTVEIKAWASAGRCELQPPVTVELARPLGQRVVIDGILHSTVARR